MALDLDDPAGDRAIVAVYYTPRAHSGESVEVLLDGREFVTFRYHPTVESMYVSDHESSTGHFVGYFPVPPGRHELSASSTSGRPPRFVDWDWENEPGVGHPPSTIELQAGRTIWVDVTEWEDYMQVMVSRRPFAAR